MATGTITPSIDSQKLFDMVYPVGSIYMSVNPTSPATLFGGTWRPIKDTFLIAAGSSYPANTITGTGDITNPEGQGQANTRLTEDHLPAISGSFGIRGYVTSGGSNNYMITAASGKMSRNTNGGSVDPIGKFATGGSSFASQVVSMSFGKATPNAINTMPPYLSVYMWERES